MGLGDRDLLDDGGGKVSVASVSCSICLDLVTDNGDRSWAKLQCGHKFHLDCIGSAFNVKGAMQCPNCRKIEKGQWLYANGSRPVPEFSMDDWAHEDDLYDFGYSEMTFGVHWCPFNGVTRLASSFDEGEFSPSTYPDLIAHHAIFGGEHVPVSSTSHPCPYVAYFGPIHPSSSASSVSVSDGSNFNTHWSGPSVPSEVSNSYAFPSVDAHYHSWYQSSPFATTNRVNAAEQSMPPMTQRPTRNNSDITRPGIHPFILGHSSSGRAPSSVTSSVLPRYPGTASRPHDRSLQPHFQQSTVNPTARSTGLSSRRRSSNLRGLAQVIPAAAASPDQPSGFHFISSGGTTGRAFQEPENPLHEHYTAWDWDHQPSSYPINQVIDRDPIWGPIQPPPVTDTGIRLGSLRQRHGADRAPSQNR
ncbi:E3 ubiquitin-protein ligase RFI2 [Andrographis paniculata]|uniref:E3 ubiquitin-protein ligase RFI2 n=1 Tax=Andrographis paniculata TaxID=175694 RepID=UPI0021E985CC|nr:E3 ubiquitin-protein ligase RFI2 [Andrographis paniculata]